MSALSHCLTTPSISYFGNTSENVMFRVQQPPWDHEVKVHVSHPQQPLGFGTTVSSAQRMLTVRSHLRGVSVIPLSEATQVPPEKPTQQSTGIEVSG